MDSERGLPRPTLLLNDTDYVFHGADLLSDFRNGRVFGKEERAKSISEIGNALLAIMDWATRAVLSWRLSNTMDPGFCVEALKEALAKHGTPEIFNTDQGSQFTSDDFTRVLKGANVQISMDGKRRWMDNVFIERLWRSLKYECVYLRELGNGHQAQREIGTWMSYYNQERPHSAFADDKTPMEMYSQRTAA